MTLSVIIPTYNESANIRPLVERLTRALDGMAHELIFVDDSTDGTDVLIDSLRQEVQQIRLFHRHGRRGLASAVVEGIAAARHDFICVLDADLQHPPESIPALLDALEKFEADLVIASRYVAGGGYDTFTPLRRLTSRVATALGRLLLQRSRQVSDPLSGFFVVRRRAVQGITLQPLGYKILLEIIVRGRIHRIVEVPYHFQARTAGQSKLTMRQQWEYVMHLTRLVRAHPDNLRFLRFAMVGASGVGVNMSVLWALTQFGAYYLYAGATAVFVATTWNFALNDAFTWRDRRSMSAAQKGTRYLQYWAVTGVGSAIHLALLYLLTSSGVPYLLSNLGGIAAAMAWNFRTNARWTWKSTEPPIQRIIDAEARDATQPPQPTLAEHAARARLRFSRYPKPGPLPRLEVIAGNGVSPRPRVSVVIPSANASRSHQLTRLLQQLETQPFRQFEIILVRGDPRQGRAINTAAAIAKGDILVTMDDDTRLGHPEVLRRLVDAMDSDPTIGIAGVSNLVPPDAPPVVQRAMRELPRRSSLLVSEVTDSDMAEHPCLAVRKDVFIRVGGEHELIPRGLDPYLRREVRQLGYRVVVVPDTWIHHLLPSALTGILGQYFRNGVGAAYVQKFYPEFVIEQAIDHSRRAPEQARWLSRAVRYQAQIGGAIASRRWIYMGTLLTYAAGYAWGWLTLSEDSL